MNSGKGHYLLLMLVIKSKPITKEEDADKDVGRLEKDLKL